MLLPWCSVAESWPQVQWRMTTILDLVVRLYWVWVCVCYQRSLSVIANQCLTCSEMLIFLIHAVLVHALSLWWTSLKVHVDRKNGKYHEGLNYPLVWTTGGVNIRLSITSMHHRSNENTKSFPYVCTRLILFPASSTSCYTGLATHYAKVRVLQTSAL